MTEQIICKNAALGYENTIVTEKLDFTVCKGDYLCILGENGSGKSTLIKALLGLKPQVSGEIKWCGDFKATQIGYLPQ
ncbi:MAG: ATP-binding cassette domain-containing protein, partial [Ruminococcus sp.]|nr:ATP-binding cassette domain-containing protein [Ruminococcus sp.]